MVWLNFNFHFLKIKVQSIDRPKVQKTWLEYEILVGELLVSRPTRWSLWYRYLDVYVDHLFPNPSDREI